MGNAELGQTCTKCGFVKPIYAFPVLKARKNGIHPRCRECQRAYHREYRLRRRNAGGCGVRPQRAPVADGSQACTKCGVVKPLSAFSKRKGRKLGVDSHCKDCHVKASHDWHQRCGNEKWRERYKSDPEFKRKIDSADRARRPKYQDWRRAWERERRRKIKLAVFEIYGNACVCCGETTSEFLSVDHTDGDGAIDRKRRNNTMLYKELAKAGKPQPGFRLLCFNCNLAKGHWGYCPHTGIKEQPSMLEKRTKARLALSERPDNINAPVPLQPGSREEQAHERYDREEFPRESDGRSATDAHDPARQTEEVGPVTPSEP